MILDDSYRDRLRLPLFLGLVAGIEFLLFPVLEKSSDFGVFFFAAQMVREGKRHLLYNLAAQSVYQARAGRLPALKFVYPPVVLAPFLALIWLPIRLAFTLWTLFNLALLNFVMSKLNRVFQFATGDWAVLLGIAFYPAASCLSNGQVSIVAFALLTASFFAWREGRELLAGIFIGLIAFKFQIILGLIAIICLKRQWKVLLGVIIGALPLALISGWIVGFRELANYPSFLRTLTTHAGLGEDPLAMANIRGLLYLVFRHDPPVWLVASLSAVVIFWAALVWSSLETGFPVAIIASLLVAYHTYPQDLVILLLPIAVLASHRVPPIRWDLVAILGFLAFPALLASVHLFSLLTLAVAVLAYRLAHHSSKPLAMAATA